MTKIWPVKDSVARVMGYARNPEKTEFADVQRVLHYAEIWHYTSHLIGAAK